MSSSVAGAQPPEHTHHHQPHVTLDSTREQFYVAQRACERFSQQLGAFVARLQEAQPDGAWLSEVQVEAHRVVAFHQQQHGVWGALAADVDAYVQSVRELAERMAVAELKGEALREADLPANAARTIHPELQRFQLEKKARILGKVGGVPALGAGMALVLPPGGAQSQVLKATASPAAREIAYSKVENKEAAQLAAVFQFRQPSSEGAAAPPQWQQEAAAKNVRRQSEAAAAELRRQEAQEQALVQGGAAELAGALRARQQALKSEEEDASTAAASSYRRVSASGNTANAPLPVRELQEAEPELAAKLKQRQARAASDAAAHAGRRGSDGGSSSISGGGGGDAVRSGPAGAAPNALSGELAAVLRKRRDAEAEGAKAGAAPVRATPQQPAVAAGGVADEAASSELAQQLKARAARLEAAAGAAALQEDKQQPQDKG